MSTKSAPSSPKERAAVREPNAAAYFVVPRIWLAAIIIALFAPWAFLGWMHYGTAGRVSPESEPPVPVSPSAGSVLGASGPWGRLERVLILVSPPLEYLPDVEQPTNVQLRWHFGYTDRPGLEQFLQNAGLGAPGTAAILRTASPAPDIQGLVVQPPRELVERLDPRTRGIIYAELDRIPLNQDQRNAFRFYGSFDEWTDGSRLPEDVLDMVETLTYPRGDYLHFADLSLVTTRISAPEVRKRLVKVMLRERTVLVKLRIPEGGNLAEIAEYWGRGGRRTDILPLLESVPPGGAIDIVHLLPAFVRSHLYRYPKVYLKFLDQPETHNCFWTSLNFFRDPPDDRFLDFKEVMRSIKQDYYVVHDNLQLGDLVMFADQNGNFYHAAVYLADNLVFSKSGRSVLAPWTITPIDRLKGYFERYPNFTIEYYRPNGI